MDEYSSLIYKMLDLAKSFASSSAFIALISAGAGAFFGALGAQWIFERSKRKNDLRTEIGRINQAIVLSFGICNSFLGLKEQLVRPIKEGFERQKEEFLEFRSKSVGGRENPIFEFNADFRTISPLCVDTILLRYLAFEKSSLIGRPLSLVDVLTQTVNSLRDSIDRRNNLINELLPL